MANVLAPDHEDHQLGEVGDVVADTLQELGQGLQVDPAVLFELCFEVAIGVLLSGIAHYPNFPVM